MKNGLVIRKEVVMEIIKVTREENKETTSEERQDDTHEHTCNPNVPCSPSCLPVECSPYNWSNNKEK